MSKQTINIGTTANDRTGDPLRTAFSKINSNFTELYNGLANETQLTNGSYNVTLGSDGTLNLPQAPSAGAAVIQPANTTYGIKLVANGNIWTLGTNGSLTFPDTSVQTTAWTGILPSPTYSGSSSIGNVTPAPLNLNNTGSAGQVKTQLTLINTAGNGNTGSAIDFYTYTDQGNGVPGARLQSIDNNNYSANFSIALKGVGNSGNNTLTTKWTFGADASLTFPDTSVQTTAYLGTATTSQIGGVKPDGTTITISSGVISAVTGAAAAGTLTGTALNSTVVTFASTTTAQTVSFANGVTASGNTNAVNIATAGASGSTTTVTIGSQSGTGTVQINGITTHSAAVKFNGALQSGGGATNITLTSNGPTMNGVTTMGIVATAQTAGNIVSAATIAPTNPITFVSGNTTINTITPPSGIATYGGQITLIPTGTWTTSTGGNIALATTTVTNKALIMTYDAGTTKWYPSY
jgi:hypothetical protein